MKTLYALESVRGPWLIGFQRGKAHRHAHIALNFKNRHVTLRVPSAFGMDAVDEAFETRRGWIDAFITTLADKPDGRRLPLRGIVHDVHLDASVIKVRVENETLHAASFAHLSQWLRQQARHDFMPHIAEFADILNVTPGTIAIRDTKSRWGSCSSNRTLSFSWRTVMAPPAVLRYLAAHEVAHLRHMDHSPAFWEAVDACMPDWPLWRDWLTLNGFQLMRYPLG